jgi:hypothetical protein
LWGFWARSVASLLSRAASNPPSLRRRWTQKAVDGNRHTPKEGRLRRRLRHRPLGAAPPRLAVCEAIRRKAKSVKTDLLFRLHSSEGRPRPMEMALPSLCICAPQADKSITKRFAVLRLILLRNAAAWMVPPVCGRSAAAARKTPPCHLSRGCHTPTNKSKGQDKRPQKRPPLLFLSMVSNPPCNRAAGFPRFTPSRPQGKTPCNGVFVVFLPPRERVERPTGLAVLVAFCARCEGLGVSPSADGEG